MKPTQRFLLLLCAGLCFGSPLAGCSRSPKPATETEVTQAAQKLPEGNAVLAALEKKDYEAAVAGLVKLQQESTPEQQPDLVTLRQHVKNKLLDVSATDPKAAEALNTIRFMATGGR